MDFEIFGNIWALVARYIYCSLYTANHYIAARALSAAPSSALPFLINYLKLIFY